MVSVLSLSHMGPLDVLTFSFWFYMCVLSCGSNRLSPFLYKERFGNVLYIGEPQPFVSGKNPVDDGLAALIGEMACSLHGVAGLLWISPQSFCFNETSIQHGPLTRHTNRVYYATPLNEHQDASGLGHQT